MSRRCRLRARRAAHPLASSRILGDVTRGTCGLHVIEKMTWKAHRRAHRPSTSKDKRSAGLMLITCLRVCRRRHHCPARHIHGDAGRFIMGRSRTRTVPVPVAERIGSRLGGFFHRIPHEALNVAVRCNSICRPGARGRNGFDTPQISIRPGRGVPCHRGPMLAR